MDFEEDQAMLRRYSAGEYPQIHGGSWREWFTEPDLRLIPPLAEAFSVYGGPDTIKQAREWAVRYHYLLASVDSPCAHSLLMVACPKMGRVCCPAFDHTNIWVPADEPEHPFILTHPYTKSISAEITAYGEAHGLEVTADQWRDGWYDGALPIRLSTDHAINYPWPMGTRSIVLASAFPVKWPEDAED